MQRSMKGIVLSMSDTFRMNGIIRRGQVEKTIAKAILSLW